MILFSNKLKFFSILFLLLFFVSNKLGAKEILDVTESDFVIGNENAPITIIEYASLSCSHCADFHINTLPEIVNEYVDSGKVKFVFRDFPFNWSKYIENHNHTRDLIEKVLPEFANYNRRVRQKGGFYLPNGPRDGPIWNTDSGKAVINKHELVKRSIPAGRFVLMTIRSHDQYNTTIYGMDDRYRGIYNSRRIVIMNPDDMNSLGLNPMDKVDLTSHYAEREITAEQWKVVPYEIPKGNLATYFPEANVLVPLDSVAEGSNTPTSKWVEVSIKTHQS